MQRLEQNNIMNILIANERILARFGVDRVLALLGEYLTSQGHHVYLMANKVEPKLLTFAKRVFETPILNDDYLDLNENTADWLFKNKADELKELKLDLVLLGGWPYFASIPFFKELGAKTVFMDCGAVPMDNMHGGELIIQNKLRVLRRKYMPQLDLILPISNFIANSQSQPDCLGQVPIETVYLGSDHLSQFSNVSADYSNAKIIELNKLVTDGYKLVFSLGRWEPGNYKSSSEIFELLRLLLNTNQKVKAVVLGSPENIAIPNDLKDSILCLGTPSDEVLVQAMELSDVGVVLSKWEGFNLPLVEMQFLSKPTFVFNCAAHPEVVAHASLMCSSLYDMAKKISKVFNKELELCGSEIANTVKDKFKWHNFYHKYSEIFENLVLGRVTFERNNLIYDEQPLEIFIDVSNSAIDPANSGVIRVTRRLSASLQQFAKPLFVLWDTSINEYVFPNECEYKQLSEFNGPKSDGLPLSSKQGRKTLSSYLQERACFNRWMIFSELTQYEQLQIIRPYLRQLEFKTASIFYDAIPILYPQFCNSEVVSNHSNYMKDIYNSDVVIPISNFSADCLQSFWTEHQLLGGVIATNELPGELGGVDRQQASEKNSDTINILCVSTIEPRKNHKTLLNAVEILEQSYPEFKFKLTLIGNAYAGGGELADFVSQFSSNREHVEWLGVVSDSELHQHYLAADFTIYPSIVEGYGMPVMESFWYAKPCICSAEGTMGELAQIGGVRCADILDPNELAEKIYFLGTNPVELKKLAFDAQNREIKNWQQYAKEFVATLLSKSQHEISFLPKTSEQRTILICSNAYPPNFIGGAEIVAHNQAKALQKLGNKVFVFVGESYSDKPHYGLTQEVYDGIEVTRVRLNSDDFAVDGNNISHDPVNAIFSELLQKINPDIVHCHNLIGLGVSFPFIAQMHGVPSFVTLHDAWGGCLKNTLMISDTELCQNHRNCSAQCMPKVSDGEQRDIPVEVRSGTIAYFLSFVDKFISPSNYLKTQYVEFGIDKQEIIQLSNGIDFEYFSNVQKEVSKQFRFSFIGYLGEHKGIMLLLEAVNKIKHLDFSLSIAGDGHLRGAITEFIEQYGLEKKVTLVGKVDNKDIVDVYSKSDCHLLPSLWPENQPVTIFESFASATPVIGTDLGGIKELITDMRTGRLFPLNNADALADCMSWFIENPLKARELGNTARLAVADISFSSQAIKLQVLYGSNSKKVINKKSFNVLCVGRHYSHAAFSGIQRVFQSNPAINFIQFDWVGVNKGQSLNADAILFVDEKESHTVIESFDAFRLPYLVHKNSNYFQQLGKLKNNSLYYNNGALLHACIEHLFKEPSDSFYMGENQRALKG